jgi:hypothetical protein
MTQQLVAHFLVTGAAAPGQTSNAAVPLAPAGSIAASPAASAGCLDTEKPLSAAQQAVAAMLADAQGNVRSVPHPAVELSSIDTWFSGGWVCGTFFLFSFLFSGCILYSTLCRRSSGSGRGKRVRKLVCSSLHHAANAAESQQCCIWVYNHEALYLTLSLHCRQSTCSFVTVQSQIWHLFPQAPKRVADSALAALEAVDAAEAVKLSARLSSGSGDGRSPAPRSALSQALSTLGSAPPRGSLTV